MDRQEAIKIVKSNLPEGRQMLSEALEFLIPELAESEDERIRKSIVELIKQSSEILNKSNQALMLAWIEKKGEQKPTEWSEEDEQFLLVCKNALAKYQVSDKWDAGIISRWLENKIKAMPEKLSDVGSNVGRNIGSNVGSWKPSDEQIRPLEYAIDYFRKKKNDTTYLESLYQDLKKLREE